MEGSSSFSDLSEDVVVEEILSRLPIEHLIKCRYVSKLWKNRFIPRVLVSQPKPTFGLIAYHSTNPMDIIDGSPVKLSLLRRMEQTSASGGEEYIQAIPNLFSLCLHDSEVFVVSSCNGLLLYCMGETESVTLNAIYFFMICNPALNQWVALPQANDSRRTRFPNIGFAAYDTTTTIIDDHQGHHYKVVHFYFEINYLLETKMIPCEIFSSEAGEWRHHQARLLSTSSIYSDFGFRILDIPDRLMTQTNPHLYHKGVIYWKFDFYNYLLLFLLEDEVFKLIPLPNDPEETEEYLDRLLEPGLLWESKGCIYYLRSFRYELRVWAYLGSSTKGDEEWVLKYLVNRQTLIPLMPPASMQGTVMRLDTFDAYSQVVYLPMRGATFAYNLETNKLTALRAYKYENNAGRDRGDLVPLTGFLRRVIPYQFTLFDLPTWDGCKVLRPKLPADKTCVLTRSFFNLPTQE